MRHYELMVILDPNLDKRTVAPSLDTFLNVVRKDGGSVDKVDVWGKRRLAYEIAKHAERARIVADLRAALDLMGKAPKDETLDARIEADLDFHRLLCRSADNETLLHSWSNLEGSIRMSIMYAGRDRAVGNMDADRHHEIVDAIDEGDPNNAEQPSAPT